MRRAPHRRAPLRFARGFSCLASILVSALPAQAAAAGWAFVDVTTSAGFTHTHGYLGPIQDEFYLLAGGVATGDYDGDGWVDVFVVRGDIGPDLLYRNRGDGTFEEVGAALGVDRVHRGSGPIFADYDGDGDLDLFVGATHGDGAVIYRNDGGTFADATAQTGITWFGANTLSFAFGDYDRDGHVDAFLTHWGELNQYEDGHLWRNIGNGSFQDADAAANISVDGGESPGDRSFTANFTDINDDNWLDITLASDFGNSMYFTNQKNGTFVKTVGGVIDDENGMGGCMGDYDNDGDMDWFVSSIWDPDGEPHPGFLYGVSGNRLYRNLGSGSFEDVTETSGVRIGYWGWGSVFADFDNDADLDIFHVNGWYGIPEFENDPARLFLSNADGTFTESATTHGIADTGQGRGVSVFDYDRDGDLDVFIANNQQAPAFYRNDGGNAKNHLSIRLVGRAPNTEAIGARVQVTVGALTQTRETHCGNNYLSQDPAIVHFGLDTAPSVDQLRVEWPSGEVTILEEVAANQRLTLNLNTLVATPGTTPAPISGLFAAPNPFRGSTDLRFTLSRPAEVSAGVFDAGGRLVATLLSGEPREAGSHVLSWDGSIRGHRAAPGVYFFKLDSGDQEVTRTVTRLP